MDQERKLALIRVRLETAHEDIAQARQELNENSLRIAVNRAYYAVFHIASAALLWQDVERARHAGVQSAFSEFLVKPGLLEPEFASIYRHSKEVRENADYTPWLQKLTPNDAERAVADAERFVQRVERYLKEVGAI